MDLLAAPCAEAHDGTGMVAGGRGGVAVETAVAHGVGVGEGVVKLHHEVVLEVIGHAAAVPRGVADNLALLRQDGDRRSSVVGVNDHETAVALGEGEAEEGCALGGHHFGGDVVVGEVDAVVIRLCRLSLVGEPTGPLGLVEDGGARDGHQREAAVVVDPRTGLVGLLQTSYLCRRIRIGPSVAHLTGLRRPEVHAPRHGDDGVGVAGGELER